MAEYVCIDASVLLKLVLPEPLASEAAGLLDAVDEAALELIAPSLLPYELAAALYKNAWQRNLEVEAALEGLALLKRIPVQLYLPEQLDDRAWEIARRCHQSVLYDSYYLALAEELGCEYWTADARFYHAARPSYGSVRLLGLDKFE